MEDIKVLVIEDDETARKQLSRVIKKEGFTVLMAENGRIGLEIFNTESPDIVISDLKMPDIDGLEVMHTIRRISHKTQIILITAFGEADTAITALREGVLDYIKKPIDLDILTIALGRAREKVSIFKKTITYPAILLAEDEETTRMRLARVLEKEGWKLYTAGNGEEAVAIFKKFKIDIILLDIKMPKKDGLTTLHEIRAISDDFEAIFITGYGDEKSAVQAMRDGAINFIRKPIDLDQMIVAVEKGIEKLKAKRSLNYRIRELELANEIMARITADKEIIIDVRGQSDETSREFAQRLFDIMPIGLLAVNIDMTIRYENVFLSSLSTVQRETLDESYLEVLAKCGLEGLTIETLKEAILRMFNADIGAIEHITVSKFAFISLTSVTVLKTIKEKVVLVVMRGERK